MEYNEIKTFDFHNASRIRIVLFNKATEDYSNDSAAFKRCLLRKCLTLE